MTLSVRDETIVPAACYDLCNNAYIEGQSVGEIPSLCVANSSFNKYYDNCHQCIKTFPETNPAFLESKFAQFLDYCNSLNGSTTITKTFTPLSNTGSIVSYFTTLTTTAWIPAVLSNNVTTSTLITVSIPLEKLTFSDASASVGSSQTESPPQTKAIDINKPSSPVGGNDNANLPPSTIIGISIGVSLGLILLAGIVVFYCIRRRKQRRSNLWDHSETKAQLHEDSLANPSSPQEIDSASCQKRAIEVEGDTPGYFELDSSMLYAELPAEYQVGEEDPAQDVKGKGERAIT